MALLQEGLGRLIPPQTFEGLVALVTPSTEHMEVDERAASVKQMLEDLYLLAHQDGCIAAAWALEALKTMQTLSTSARARLRARNLTPETLEYLLDESDELIRELIWQRDDLNEYVDELLKEQDDAWHELEQLREAKR